MQARITQFSYTTRPTKKKYQLCKASKKKT